MQDFRMLDLRGTGLIDRGCIQSGRGSDYSDVSVRSKTPGNEHKCHRAAYPEAM